MCRKIASALVENDTVELTLSCATHGNPQTLPVPLAQIPEFLGEGFFGMAIGAVPPDAFYTIVEALVAAGVKVPGDYLRN